jgi:hypothetical protein
MGATLQNYYMIVKRSDQSENAYDSLLAYYQKSQNISNEE